MSHDQNFKNLILDYPRQALAFFAAAEAQALGDGARIVPIRQEQLKERLGERFRELDTPLLVEWPDGRREALLFVIEEDTKAERFSIHRLTHYCLDLAELLKTERVVPVVIFLRGRAARRELNLGGDRHEYLRFRYLACELSVLWFEDYLDSDNLVARLNLPNMHYPPERRVEVYARAVRGLSALEPDRDRQLKYLEFVDIYTRLNDDELRRYRHEYPEETVIMNTFAERFIEQGKQQGLQQGMQQGMQQGEARMLIRQLTRKFGELPEATRQRIELADADMLLHWSERVLNAERLEDVLD